MAVDLLALAHDRSCEAELAAQLEEDLRLLFAPTPDTLPGIDVQRNLAWMEAGA